MSPSNKVDVCIIGSGAGGAVVAKELGERGISVVVLEAGRRFNPVQDYQVVASSDWERNKPDHLEKFNLPQMDTVTYGDKSWTKPHVAYGVGGSTLLYLANYIRMLPDDFRTYSLDGVGADWPISYSDLAPYYEKVEWELGVSGKGGGPWFPDIKGYPNSPFEFAYHDKILEPSFKKLGMRLWPNPSGRPSRPFDGRPACIQCGHCSSGCLIRAKSSADVTYIAKAEATGKIEIRTESVVTRIETDSGGRAKSVSYFDRNGMEHELEAKIIILSAGGIQSPRILLNSRSSLFPDGLGNSSGLVGRNYMIHSTLESKALLNKRVDSFRGHSQSLSLDCAKTSKDNAFVRGFSLKPSSYLTGPAITAIKTPGWGAYHKKYMRENYGHLISLRALGETLPSEHNRIELDPQVTDNYGMPVPRLTNEPSENDKLMLKAIEKKTRDIFSAAGAADITIQIPENRKTAHNMGTCRMGNDPRTSVLNSFCRSHDVKNLFVVDASCYVTSGTANPSLTIQAIAKRSAEYIVEESKKGTL